MSKTLMFARHWALLPALSFVFAASCVSPAQAQDDPLKPHLTAHLSNLSFLKALELLSKTANVKLQIPADLAAKVDPNETYNVDISDGSFQDALNYLLEQVDPPLTYRVENGAVVLEASKKPRIGKAKKKPPVVMEQHVTFSMQDTPFEEAVGLLFDTQRIRYRIDPAVSAYLEPVSFTAEDATPQRKLVLLLEAVSGQTAPLVFRKEQDVFVIEPKDKTRLPDLNTTPIGLPSYHPKPTIKSVSIQNEHPQAGLLQMFEQAGVNYHFVQPSSVADTPRVSLAMRSIPLEQAVVHLLRSAPANPPLHLKTYKDWAADPDIVYTVGPGWVSESARLGVQDADRPVYHHWFRFHDYNLYSALKLVLADGNKNYSLDPALREVKIAAVGSDLPFEKALSKLVESASLPVQFTAKNNVLYFRLLRQAAVHVKH